MPSSEKAVSEVNEDLRRKMSGLILGRLTLIFLLLLASWWWTSSYLSQSIQVFPRGLFLFFVISIVLTAAYWIALYFDRDYSGQARVQFFIDMLLVTWLVFETGNVSSPYISLYIILISVVGIFLDKNYTLFIAGTSAASLTILSILSTQVFDNLDSPSVPLSRIVQLVGVNVVALLLVGLLAARLSARIKVTEELKEKAENFSNLNVLHERIVQSIGSGLITTGRDRKIFALNRAAEEISGRRSDEVEGVDLFSLFGPEIFAPVERCLSAVQGDEIFTEHFEATIASAGSRNDLPRQVACSVSPLISKAGRTSGLILAFQDLTHVRALEETVRRTDRLAAVGRMAAGLAHEIRNPLGSMSSALQFLHEKVPPATDEAELMKLVLRESERLNNIIANFLAYARPPEDGFVREGSAIMDLGEAIGDCVVLLKHSPEINERHFLEYEKPDPPVTIKANETEIKQVFWNLLQNSMHAMPDGGKLLVELDDSAGSFVKIAFTDTGRGISAAAREHLFEPFAEGASGTGLGLSIVHKIITDHGGRIDVQSESGEGTKITLDLPR